MKFAPQTAGSTQQATYATVRDAVIQKIQKTYEGSTDLLKSLKDMQLVNLAAQEPTRKLSTNSNADMAKIEQDGFNIKYEAELKRFLDKQDNLTDGLIKAYALIFDEFCTKSMQQRIEQHPEYEKTIRDNPIELLEAIKTLMHDSVRAQYPYVSLVDALTRLLNIRQIDGEDMMDYVKRTMQHMDVVASHIGKRFLDTFVEHSEQYRDIPAGADQATEQKAMKDAAFEQLGAYILIRGADQSKYGSVIKGMTSQFSMGNDQYPKDLVGATDILSNHRYDPAWQEKRDRARERARAAANQDTTDATSFTQAGRKTPICYCCGKKGHTSDECSKRNSIPRDQWYVKKALQAMQDAPNEDSTTNQADDDSDASDDSSVRSTSSRTSRRPRRSGRNDVFSGFQRSHNSHQYKQANIKLDTLKNRILLDTGSTIGATFMNPDFVTNVRPSKTALGMTTNAGTTKITLKADLGGHGDVWYDPNQVANIFGFSHMADKYRITYDSDKEDAFLVHSNHGIIKFARTEEGLYAYTPPEKFLEAVADEKNLEPPTAECQLEANYYVSTVKENRMGYTQREFDRAKRAREFYKRAGCPSPEAFKRLLRQYLVKNNPVTTADADIAEKVFGPDVGALKGKSTRKRPVPVLEDLVAIPRELIERHQDLTLCMDVMYVCGLPMFTCIDRSPKYRACVPLNNRSADELYRALDVVLRRYNQAGFEVKTIHCDNEFKPLMNKVYDDLKVTMNYTSADEHVPEAERNNRTIAERYRATFHDLPYKMIPKLMIQYLCMVSTKQLTWYPVKGGISEYFSPHVILGGRPLDYNKDFKSSFGQYVLANHEDKPYNTPKARMIDAIYLRPSNNIQGGHDLMDLHTGQLITRQVIKNMPVTDAIIRAVEGMAEKQGFKSLKFANRNKIPFPPADWLAGVDYDYNYDDDDDQDDDNEDSDYLPDLDDGVSVDSEDSDDDDELDDEENFDRIDQAELDELLAKPRSESTNEMANPTGNDEPQAHQDDNNGDATDTEPDVADTEEAVQETRRSSRQTQPVDRLTYAQVAKKAVSFEDGGTAKLEHCHNLITQVHPNPDEDVTYSTQLAMVIARLMVDINEKATDQGASFAQQYIFQKGLKVFGARGSAAALKELDQLHRRTCFTPLSIAELTPSEKKKAMEALMFLTEKRDKTIKGRMVYNGKPTREWLSREDSASPTAALESIMLTAVIDAHEERDVMSADVPNAFIQTMMPQPEAGQDRVVMKISGVLVDLLVQMAPETYGPYVVFENGRKVLYVQVIRALYGMLEASLLWYKKFRKDLEGIGFVFNPYDPCVANRTVRKRQHTVRFHVDDLLSSHKDPKVNDAFDVWLNKTYGGYGKVKCTRGKVHDYLGMTFDFSQKGKVIIDMVDYIASMVDDSPIKLKPGEAAPSPAAEDLFSAPTGDNLDRTRAEQFHTVVAKGLFACKRARPDLHTAIAALCTRVKAPTTSDWKHLVRLLKFCNGTRGDKLILSADNLHVIKWYVDAAFAVHPDFKSHTGGVMTFGNGTVQSISRKQRLNTRSSTESELVGADDASVLILWTKLFMEAQGYDVEKNILNQDNKSSIKLENNGKRSSGQCTRAFNIRYFFLTDQVEKGNLSIEYCPTDEMIGDYMTKPLQGKLFKKFRDAIMGH